jgi:hypothetical protein
MGLLDRFKKKKPEPKAKAEPRPKQVVKKIECGLCLGFGRRTTENNQQAECPQSPRSL